MVMICVAELILLVGGCVVAFSSAENPLYEYVRHGDWERFANNFNSLTENAKEVQRNRIFALLMKQNDQHPSFGSLRIVGKIIRDMYSDRTARLEKDIAKFIIFFYLNSRPWAWSSSLNFAEVSRTRDIDLPFEGRATTLLHRAVGSMAIPAYYVRILIDAGANLDLRNNFGKTALQIAVAKLDPNTVALLTSRHANLEIRDNYGLTALHIACIIYDDVGNLKPELSMKGSQGDEQLSEVVRIRKDIVRQLLKLGAEQDVVDESNRTPLHYAVQNGFVSVVELLVDAGADVNVKSRKNETPFHVAMRLGHQECFGQLMHGDYGWDTYESLKRMCTDESLKISTTVVCATKLEEMEESLRLKRSNQYAAGAGNRMTKLHYAVRNDFKYLVQKLVSNDADVNVKSPDDETPFDMALRLGHEKCFAVLMNGDYTLDTYISLRKSCSNDLYENTNMCTINLKEMELKFRINPLSCGNRPKKAKLRHRVLRFFKNLG